MKTNLFIVGSPKCGTTFLVNQLSLNKNILLPRVKELNFFSHDLLKIYKSYYKSFSVKKIDNYERFFKSDKKFKYYVDASVSYFTFDEVPQRIFNYNPNSKIIICYRDPLKRAISHYKMDLRMGYVKTPLIQLINKKDSFYYRQYIYNSLFYRNSKKYIDQFGSENVFFYNLDSPDNFSLSNFLGFKVEIDMSLKVNKSKSSRNFVGDFFLKYRSFTISLKRYLPQIYIDLIKKILYKEDDVKFELGAEEIKKINAHLVEDWNKFNLITKNE